MTNPSVEVYYKGDPAKLVHDRPCAPKKGDILVQRLYLTGARRAVVQRDDDTLTPEELKLHAQEVAASMLSELNLGSPKMLQSSQSCDGKEHDRPVGGSSSGNMKLLRLVLMPANNQEQARSPKE